MENYLRNFGIAVLLFLAILTADAQGQAFPPEGAGAVSSLPAISQKVRQQLEGGQSVRVIIKLREVGEPSEVSRSATARIPSRFISRQDIRRLQDRVEADFSFLAKQGDISIHRRLENIPWLAAVINSVAFAKLETHPNVAAIIEDAKVHAFLAESGPLIGASTSYSQGFGGLGATVAVLDTGIDTDNPDLADDLEAEACFLSEGGCPSMPVGPSGSGKAEDGNGHGTHVAGIITSANSSYRGIAPDAGIVAVKVLDNAGNGFTSDIMAAIDWVTKEKGSRGIDIINMSLGGSQLYQEACDSAADETGLAASADAAREAGLILFAASGNSGAVNALSSPACLSAVLSVGSVYDGNVGNQHWNGASCTDIFTAADKISCFSNVSAALDFLAPGAMIDSTAIGGGITEKAGTSMATPHAAAVAALLLGVNPFLSADQLESIMKQSGKSVYDGRIDHSFPRVNALAALEFVRDNDGDGYTNKAEELAGSDADNADSRPGSSMLTLNKGYNQLSFPAETLYYGDLQALMEALGGSSVIEKVLVFDQTSQQFIEAGYDAGSFYGTNLSLPSGQGLEGMIIYALQDYTINFSSKYCRSWNLKPGVNLTGSGCIPEGLTAHQLFNAPALGAANVSSIQRFNPESGEFETTGYDEAGNIGGADFPILSGEGYIVNMKQEVIGFRP